VVGKKEGSLVVGRIEGLRVVGFPEGILVDGFLDGSLVGLLEVGFIVGLPVGPIVGVQVISDKEESNANGRKTVAIACCDFEFNGMKVPSFKAIKSLLIPNRYVKGRSSSFQS